MLLSAFSRPLSGKGAEKEERERDNVIVAPHATAGIIQSSSFLRRSELPRMCALLKAQLAWLVFRMGLPVTVLVALFQAEALLVLQPGTFCMQSMSSTREP